MEFCELRDSLRNKVDSSMSGMVDSVSSTGSRSGGMSSTGSRSGGMSSRTGTSGGSRLEVTSMGQQEPIMCPLHEGIEIHGYCESCNKVLCLRCCLNHKSHEIKLVEDIVGEYKAVMSSQMEKVNHMAGEIKKSLTTIDARNEQVGNFRTSIEGDIHTVFKDLHKMLDARENELVQQLDKTVNRKLKTLAEERDMKETFLLEANSCTQQVKDALHRKSDTEVLLLKKTLMKRLEETVYQFSLLKVSMEADMVLSVPPDFARQCKEFGHILTPESIDPQKCVAKGCGMEVAIVDKKAVIFMKVQDLNVNPILNPIPNLECKVIVVRTGDVTKCEVQMETEEENLYKISYIPAVQGAHEVHIKVNSMHIQGSPFPVVVRPPVEKLRKLTTVIDDVVQPWGIVINQKNQIVVSECDGHKVSIFGQDGTKIRIIGTEEGADGKPLKWARGIALDNKGNIFVVEMGNYSVKKFDEQGKLLASGGTKGKGGEQFQDPKGLAFNSVNNKVYVADVNRVQVMNSNLAFVGSFGRQGTGEGQFMNAFSIACDNRGNVYVSDNKNGNIQVFTADGEFLKTFLSKGRWGLWSSGTPVGLAIDAYGLVYVSDNSAHHISVFSPEGVCMTTIGGEGSMLGEFKRPRGIAVTEMGMIYVCDFGNNQVVQVGPKGSLSIL